jgi:hypothetical protein
VTHTLSFGDVLPFRESEHRIVLPVQVIVADGSGFEIQALLDTGSGISVFDKGLVGYLGIPDVTTGAVVEITSASQVGTSDTGYIHELSVVILDRSLTIPVVFCPSWPEGTVNVLGMRGFFDHWLFAIDHARRRLYYEPAT